MKASRRSEPMKLEGVQETIVNVSLGVGLRFCFRT
jgi:hypothetical protein